MEALLLVLFSIADQGPVAGWALTHALHHCASDTGNDPHNRGAGFWHSHFGWLFSAKSFSIGPKEFNRIVGGLGPLVRLHDTVCLIWDPLLSLGLPTLLASQWGEPTAGFFVAGALRWAFVQHFTFLVNSVAHGEREAGDLHTFDAAGGGIGPRVSLVVTVLALGEGWHDYHHAFPWDYAAAELDAWDQWNPTKVFIDVCANLGLVRDRRRCSPELQQARKAKGLVKEGIKPASWTAKYVTVGPLFLRNTRPAPSPLDLGLGAESFKCQS